MTSALKKAVRDSAAIVVTGWKPHWMFGSFDLKFLAQDSGKKVWKKGNIHIMGRKDIETDKPELAAFLKNMYFTDAQLADLMLAVEKSPQDITKAIDSWMASNEDLVDSWIPEKETAAAE
jgi:glycine betaine/proline transport system substrate-binding protein